jgi:hypothetical protein
MASGKLNALKGMCPNFGDKRGNDCSNSFMALFARYPFGMQIRESLTKGLLIALALILIPVSANSAQKVTPGSTCKIFNQKVVFQNKNYTCIQSGKKLVWSKGVVTKKPVSATSAQPIPKFTPPTLPTSFQNLEANLSGIIYGSWLKGSEQLKSGSSNLGEIKVFNGPKSLPGNINPLAPFKLTSQLYSNFEQPKTVYAIVISYGENDWAQGLFSQYQDLTYGNIRTAVSEICPTQTCGQSIAFRNSKWEGILLLQNGARGKNRDSDTRIDSGMEYAHEYFHTVQFYVGRDRYYEAPSWLLEGSANWTGNLVAFHDDYSAYSAWRLKDLGEQYGNPSLFTSAWVEEFLNSYATKKPAKQYAIFDYYNGPYPRYYQYAIGAMVTEILVTLKGPDSILGIYKQLASGKTFEQAFQSEFDSSWDEALPYISNAISAQLTKQVKS